MRGLGTNELEDAIEAYRNAESREEERKAYQRLRAEFGLPTRYGEQEEPELEQPSIWFPGLKPERLGDVGMTLEGTWWIKTDSFPVYRTNASTAELDLGLFDVSSYDDYFVESGPAVSGNSGQEPNKE